jgi:hypothetical protein
MSTTDELLRNAQGYAASFEKGDLPLQPLHPAQGLGARLRLRGRERAPARGDLSHQAQ